MQWPPIQRLTERWPQRAIDVGLYASLTLAPWVMGGRHPLGKFVLAAMAWTVGLLTWFAAARSRRQRLGWCAGEWIFVGGALLLMAQLLPLPFSARSLLSPAQVRLFPLWDQTSHLASAGLLPWQTVSLTPENTRQGLCLFLAYAALFVSVRYRIRSIADVTWLLNVVIQATIAMALIGVVQYLFGNGKFLWLYEHPTRTTFYTVKGSFANQNHFVHFLSLGVGPLLAWLTLQAGAARRRNRSFVTSGAAPVENNHWLMLGRTALGLVGFAAMMAFSRGGLLVLLTVAGVSVAILAWRRLLSWRVGWTVSAVVSVLAIAVAIHGGDRLLSRVGTVMEGSLESVDPGAARRRIWSAVMAAIPDFWRLGAGAGSHTEIYPTYLRDWAEIEYTHAENGYLQVMLETGLPGVALLATAIFVSGRWLWLTVRRSRSRQTTACAAGIFAAWVGSLLHSLIDFVWYIPACAATTIVLLAAAQRLSQLATGETGQAAVGHSGKGWPRVTKWAVGASVAVLALACLRLQWAAARAGGAWDRYLICSLAAQDAQRERDLTQLAETPESRADTEVASASNRQMAEHLQQVLQADPHNARAHLRYASVCLERFELAQRQSENPMPLSSIRAAAVASQFSTHAAFEAWLEAATGPHRHLLNRALIHARIALQLCPLQGKAYLHLADLLFLEGKDAARTALMQQAAAVRPYDGAVLYTIAFEQLRRGDVQAALETYRRAFQRGPEIQQQIIRSLSVGMSGKTLLQIFQPDREGAQRILDSYRAQQRAEDARDVARYYVNLVESEASRQRGVAAGQLWYTAQETYGYLRELPAALRAAQQAVYEDPTNFRYRFVLAARLDQTGQHRRALEQFQWCLRRRPDDASLRQRMARLETRLKVAGELSLRQ